MVLEDAVRGQLDLARARTLAELVLSSDATRLALEIRNGGPHTARRAIELAALVLAEGVEVEEREG